MRFAVWMALALGLFLGHRFSGAAAAQPSRARILAETIPGSVPPEFAADLLTRLADSPAGRKEGPEWREIVYRQAFELAGAAQDPAPFYRSTGAIDYRT